MEKIGLAQHTHASEYRSVSLIDRWIHAPLFIWRRQQEYENNVRDAGTRAFLHTHSLIDFNKVKLSKWHRNTSPYCTRMSAAGIHRYTCEAYT